MRTLLLTLVAAGALTVAGTASAGGWATAGVSPAPDNPDGRVDLGREDHDPPARPDPARGRLSDDRADRDRRKEGDVPGGADR